MRVKILNISKRTVIVCGNYLAPKKSLILDWNTISYNAKASINSLVNLGLLKVTIIDPRKEMPEDDIPTEEDLNNLKSNRKTTKKSK